MVSDEVNHTHLNIYSALYPLEGVKIHLSWLVYEWVVCLLSSPNLLILPLIHTYMHAFSYLAFLAVFISLLPPYVLGEILISLSSVLHSHICFGKITRLVNF